jgi:acetyl-CoA C-acetyltransferase
MQRQPAYEGGRPVYIVDGSRTPFLKAKEKPGPFTASDLAVAAGRSLLARQPFSPTDLDEVILGCVIPRPEEANIARVVALRLGCGKKVPAYTVQRNCGSGMQSLDNAAMAIAHGRADLVLAGGTESMSHAPILWNHQMVEFLGAWQRSKSLASRLALLSRLRPAHFQPVIGLLLGLTDPVVGLSMGQTAENLARRFNISRTAMDTYAMESHHRLARAHSEGRLTEIVPLYDSQGNAYDHDEGVRPDSSLASLAKLKPVFDPPFGNVTAGNSSQVTDGAAWLLLASAEGLKQHSLTPMARIVDCQWAGLAPEQMGLGPVHAMAPLFIRQKLSSSDMAYFEINEAFAAQVLACLTAWESPDYCRQELGLDTPLPPIDRQRLNVDGGAVAVGHPVGCSGSRIVLHLADLLRRNNGRYGMASLCIGGGQGGAMLIAREG